MRIVRILCWSALIVGGVTVWLAEQACDPRDISPTAARRSRLMWMSVSIDTYVEDVGQLPASLSELVASNAPHWKGPYLRASKLTDPDGIDVRYAVLDAEALRYRLTVPAHAAKSGTPMPEVVLEQSAAWIRNAR